MRRSAPPRRKSPLRSGPSRLKRGKRAGLAKMPKRKKRSAAETERIYGSQEFRDWLHAQPCAVSGRRGNIEQAHVRNGGMSRKADACWTIPLDRGLHRELHQIGQRTFEEIHHVSLTLLAEATEARWQEYSTRSTAA